MKCIQLPRRVSFVSMILLTASFFIVELSIGYLANSMALVADSFHMLSDVVSLLVGYMALRFTKTGTQTGRYTFGWARAEVLGALVNAVFLVALCFSILVQALKRVVVPEELSDPKLVLITGGIGLFINIIGLFLFHQHGHGHSHGGSGHSHGEGKRTKETETEINDAPAIEADGQIDILDKTTALPLLMPSEYEQTTPVTSADNGVNHTDIHNVEVPKDLDVEVKDGGSSSSTLNLRGVYLHVLGDALGSVIVMISALIILYTSGEWTKYVDPSLSILMVMIILKTSLPLLKESSMILMQTVPTHIKVQEIQDRLVECIPGVLGVHEFHIWQLAGSRIIASAHVRCKTLQDYMAIANQVKEFFHNEGIHSTTIQPEFVEPVPKETLECLLECKESCSQRTCCGNSTSQPIGSKKHGGSLASSPKNKVGSTEMISEMNVV